MEFPKIWMIMENFKTSCQTFGWKISKNEDCVYANENYHHFVWARIIHSSTFKKINATQKCAVKEGISYKVIDTAFTAWIFLQKPSEELINTLQENPALLKRTAIYDLSEIYQGNPVCVRYNNTNSVVFKKFEKFLEDMGIKMKTVAIPSSKVTGRNSTNLLVAS